VAERLGLKLSNDGSHAEGASGAAVLVRVALVPELHVGSAVVRNVPVVVAEDAGLNFPNVSPGQLRMILRHFIAPWIAHKIPVCPGNVIFRTSSSKTPSREGGRSEVPPTPTEAHPAQHVRSRNNQETVTLQ